MFLSLSVEEGMHFEKKEISGLFFGFGNNQDTH